MGFITQRITLVLAGFLIIEGILSLIFGSENLIANTGRIIRILIGFYFVFIGAIDR